MLINPLPRKSKGTLDLHYICLSVSPAYQFSAVYFFVLEYIDLIFDILFYDDKIQIKFKFCSGLIIYGPWTYVIHLKNPHYFSS